MESTLKTKNHGQPCLEVSYTGGFNDAYRVIDLALQRHRFAEHEGMIPAYPKKRMDIVGPRQTSDFRLCQRRDDLFFHAIENKPTTTS